MMRYALHLAIWLILVSLAATPAARADYAVLRSGARLHVTSYQRVGDEMRLTVDGGTVEVAVSDVVAIQPEEVFAPNPPATSAPTVSGPYAKLIRSAAAKRGVDGALIQRVIAAESNFNPRAVSPKDAFGLMQLLPETAGRYSVVNLFDPAQNIDAGTRYLKTLLDQYNGNVPLALAAYNAGPETVARYGGVPPFPETQNYVRRITSEMAKSNGRGQNEPLSSAQRARVTLVSSGEILRGQHRPSE
jgi:soluble lytic murein transglycosylase-like protein